MELKNGYKVLYNGTDGIYASKELQNVEGKAVVYKSAADGSVVDPKTFKLIYAKGVELFGSIKEVPTEADVKFYLEDGEGNCVFGEKPEAPTEEVTE